MKTSMPRKKVSRTSRDHGNSVLSGRDFGPQDETARRFVKVNSPRTALIQPNAGQRISEIQTRSAGTSSLATSWHPKYEIIGVVKM